MLVFDKGPAWLLARVNADNLSKKINKKRKGRKTEKEKEENRP